MAIESKMSRGPIGRPQQESGKSRFGAWTWIVILLFIALLGGAWYYTQENKALTDGSAEVSNGSTSSSSDDYQAVFLDNGQVYFGKLEKSKKDFYTLRDVFYLQSGVAVDQETNLSLTKLGSEAHGPEDQMEINVSHILFFENMTENSKVLQAIQQYKSNQ